MRDGVSGARTGEAGRIAKVVNSAWGFRPATDWHDGNS
jgi:hypothetical protein